MGDFPRRFYLYRGTDITGVSGPGLAAWGVVFTDGVVVMRWCVDGKPKSTTTYDRIEDVVEIHGHDGNTEVIFEDPVMVRAA